MLHLFVSISNNYLILTSAWKTEFIPLMWLDLSRKRKWGPKTMQRLLLNDLVNLRQRSHLSTMWEVKPRVARTLMLHSFKFRRFLFSLQQRLGSFFFWIIIGLFSPFSLTHHQKQFDGIDVFVDYDPVEGRDANVLATKLRVACAGSGFELSMISNRGVVVWPNGRPETFKVDHWRCRFKVLTPHTLKSASAIGSLLHYLEEQDLDVIKTENLYKVGCFLFCFVCFFSLLMPSQPPV